jgi:hypothetical protein
MTIAGAPILAAVRRRSPSAIVRGGGAPILAAGARRHRSAGAPIRAPRPRSAVAPGAIHYAA